MDENLIAKVGILLDQKRFADAETILSSLLSSNPNDSDLLQLMAETQLCLEKLDLANELINQAIANAPDDPNSFYVKAKIKIHEQDFNQAEKCLYQAIELDPFEANFHATLAAIRLNDKQFEQALQTANHALELDPENLLALNLRSTALNKLNLKEEAFQTIEGALSDDPNNPYTHANYGWGLLENGQHKKALVHFKEALTHDPTLNLAITGMLEAIKASNPVYRLFLKYSFWMGNLTAKYQWGVIIGFYFLSRILRTTAQSNPELKPYLNPLTALLAFVAFSTWIIEPLSNLFLRFNKYGKILMGPKQKMSANFVAAFFAVFVVGVLLYAVSKDEKMLILAGYGFGMMVPMGSLFISKKEKLTIGYAVLMALIGALAIFKAFVQNDPDNSFITFFILLFVGFQFLANYLSISESNR